MKKNPLISICILNHNWENRLPKAIPSIISQNYDNIEILFLDNWSTDKSLDYISQFKEIKAIKSDTNLWISGWRNKLVKVAKWEYLLFLDNDVELIEKNFLSELLDGYKSLNEKNIWVLFPIVRMEHDTIGCEIWLSFTRLQKVKFSDVYKRWYIMRPWFLWTIFFIKKTIFQRLWWFDEKYPFNIDDNDLSMRLYNMWYTIYVDTNLYVIHHGLDARTTAESIWWRYQYYLCWLMRAVIKNYTKVNLIKWWFLIVCWILLKALKLSFKYRSFLPLKSSFKSLCMFFNDLWETNIQRKILQKNRIVKDDVFLMINNSKNDFI